jgi:truncated hemoglobin YjbI
MAGYFPILTPQQANPTLNSFQQTMANHLMRQQAQQKIADMKTQNQMNQARLPYLAQEQQADLLSKSLQNELEKTQLKYAPQEEQAKLAQMLAQAKYYQQGGYGSGRNVANQLREQLVKQIAIANPQIANDPTKLREAVNDVIAGKPMLSDGTPLTVDELVQGALNNYAKNQTTSPLLTNQVNANQAEAEQNVLTNLQKEYIAPYGDTYKGHSFAQIADSFKDDDASQQKLGQYLAAQTLLYEQTQLQQRLAGAKSSVAATQEILNSSPIAATVSDLRLSGKAKQAYLKTMQDAMTKLLNARNKVGIGAAQTLNAQQAQNVEPTNNTSSSSDDPLGIL